MVLLVNWATRWQFVVFHITWGNRLSKIMGQLELAWEQWRDNSIYSGCEESNMPTSVFSPSWEVTLVSGLVWLSWLIQEVLRLQGIVALVQRLSSCHRVARLMGTRSALAILLGKQGRPPPLLLLVTVTFAGPGSWAEVWFGRSGHERKRKQWEARSQRGYTIGIQEGLGSRNN